MTRASNPPTPRSLRTPAALLGEASRLPQEQRGAFLDEACAGNASLRREVEELLGFMQDGFMERGPVQAPIISPDLVPDPADVLEPGTQVSRYTIERVLGQGGMGVVYLAQQENPRRSVALKLVGAGIASPSVMKRFQREAALMGRLQHPGIVQIFEAGEAEIGRGRQPYLAMEFVSGLTLMRHLRERGLGVRGRMEILARVSDAVQHAHERGLVHRDLKPGNILVTESGEPKVLDFGVAREPVGATTTVATSVGQLIGTLAYMSPEQAGADPSRVDARSDVYSIGVMMYEALTGRLPLAVRHDAVAEAVRAIREDEPARPSTIDRVLRGDVETIVLKALEKDPERRYQSAGELAADIRRYLAGDPIVAKQDSTLYVLQKKLRRYRWAVGAGVVFVAVVAGFAAWSVMQAREMSLLAKKESEAKNEATQSAARAQAAEQARTIELRMSDIERGRLLSRTGDAGQGEALLWRAHVQDPLSAQSHWALREHYALAPCLTSFRAGAGLIRTIALDTAAETLTLCRWDGHAEVWDVNAGTILRTFEGPRTSQNGVLSASGWLVSGTRAGPVAVWDPQTGSHIADLSNANKDTYVAVSRDGSMAASGGADGVVTLWSLPGMERVADIETGHSGGIMAVAFSADGERLATGGRDRAARVWHVAGRVRIGELKDLSGAVSSVAFSADGKQLVCGSANWTARLWDLQANTSRTFADDLGVVPYVAFVREDALIAAMGEYGISLFDAKTLVYVGDLGNHGEPVTRIAVSGDGEWLVSISRDSLVKVWDFSRDGPAKWLVSGEAPEHGILNVGSASADGSLIATISSSGGVEIWDSSARFVRHLPGPGSMGQYDVSLNRDATLVAGAANDGVVRVWNVNGEGRFRELRGHKGIVNCVRFAPSGDLLASCGDDGRVILWDAVSGRIVHDLQGSIGRLHRVRFAGGVVLASGARQVAMWDAATGSTVSGLPIGESDVFSIDASRDGRTIAVGYRRRAIGLFDLETRTHIGDLTGHSELPWNMAFSPDGKLLLSCTAAGSLKIWDVASRVCLGTFRDEGHGWLMPVEFVPGSSKVLIGHQHRGVSMWDLAYYDRHIAGNAREQIGRLEAELGAAAVVPAREWASMLEREHLADGQ